MVERFMVMLIPIVTLMLPLIRFAPPVYRWQIRRRIYRWYGNLRDIEQRALGVTTAAEGAAILEQLNRVEAEVCKVHVPLGFAESHYHLRTHIEFIKRLVEGKRAAGPAEG
jgi:hypothetical protein